MSLAANTEYSTETREELLYNKEKLLGKGSLFYSASCSQRLMKGVPLQPTETEWKLRSLLPFNLSTVSSHSC